MTYQIGFIVREHWKSCFFVETHNIELLPPLPAEKLTSSSLMQNNLYTLMLSDSPHSVDAYLGT